MNSWHCGFLTNTRLPKNLTKQVSQNRPSQPKLPATDGPSPTPPQKPSTPPARPPVQKRKAKNEPRFVFRFSLLGNLSAAPRTLRNRKTNRRGAFHFLCTFGTVRVRALGNQVPWRRAHGTHNLPQNRANLVHSWTCGYPWPCFPVLRATPAEGPLFFASARPTRL